MNTQRWKSNQQAVSAVIGVIIMVAITIAMAAVAYAYFTGMIGGTNKVAPVIEFTADETLDRIIVSSTDPNVKWSDLSLRASKNDVTFAINTEIDATGGTAIASNTVTPIATASILAPTDFIDLEGHDGANGIQVLDITITINHIASETTLVALTFQSIAAAAT